MMRRRCRRGHFILATAETDACQCTLRPRRQHHAYRFAADLWGQGLPARTIRTVALAGRYL
ncbi:hypothetical protein [Streptomyces sp. NPDC003032]